MVLGSALQSGSPSHAYLFHGPPGTGKRSGGARARGRAAGRGRTDPDNVRLRVAHGSHPDLTWVVPSGAHVMRVDDVEEPVVSAATRTPFESRKRVFVLERVDLMNDEVANRMLKTLEEPPAFVHLILLTSALGRVLETVVSRCQLVRFDPLSAERLTDELLGHGIEPDRATACARLALGSGERARYLASAEGEALRSEVEALVRHTLAGEDAAADEPWRALLARAEGRRETAEEDAAEQRADRIELEPKGRERRALERELEEAAKREGRRARTPCSTWPWSSQRCPSATSYASPRARTKAVLAARPAARARRGGALARPAPAADGRGAMRGSA
jgi:DNA polymerase-3 subunit delta'